MALTLGDWLRVVSPHLTEPLFSKNAVRRLTGVASLLPGDCLSILETRLTPAGGPVDLSLRLRDRPEGLLPATIWHELDLHRDFAGLPPPVVAARLDGDFDPLWLVDTLLPALHGKPLQAGQRELVLSCCRRLPPGANLLYAFSLRARGKDQVRLEIGCNPDLATAYVGSFAPDHAHRVERWATLLRRAERFHLSFDVGTDTSPRFGLEGSFSRQPAREPGWSEVFDDLEAAGLCTAEQRDAVFAWPGSASFWSAPSDWPVTEVRTEGHLVRSLSHVKLVTLPDGAPEAKAYLALAYVGSTGEASSARSRSRWVDSAS